MPPYDGMSKYCWSFSLKCSAVLLLNAGIMVVLIGDVIKQIKALDGETRVTNFNYVNRQR
jgi:hypothetical protein